MTLSDKFNPQAIEEKWYSYWLEKQYFKSQKDNREPYTIVIPPPNVTGVLHMGHMLNNTIQDILVRRSRMQGKNACWVPGTDHASIATEAKVVAMLKEKGIEKSTLTREDFLKHAWEWKEKHGGIILEQLKRLGASCDWDRTCFTMDKIRYESVIKVFVDLYEKGLIYRGVRMVNWDPEALTALSDEEVFYKEVQSKLYYLRYAIENRDNQWVTIATTRPETILGDTAICINPDDERYSHLKDQRVFVPLVNRSIPIIFDEYVEKEFGTGCLKVTPAHDLNDYNLGEKHNLDSIDIFNSNGSLNENAKLYVGMDRFEVRDRIVKDLESAGNLVKIENYTNKVGYSERTNSVIEPKLSTQWFLKMDEISKPALEVVLDDTVKFFPEKFKNTYRHWMENVHDWCISRQLWWGQRIPAYFLPDNKIIVAETPEKALEKAKQINPTITKEQLRQDEDVLDTWFSSWLWPISVFNGILEPENQEIKYYYPTNDLITAPEIMFFWVARMIIAGVEYRNQIPFRNVYFTGIVRDKLGRKMSKSLGNSPDPIELIEKFGADGVRIGMLLTSPAGNDLPFDESLCEQGRNFSNKIWNALRLIKGWNVDSNVTQPQYTIEAINWFENKLNQEIDKINDCFDKFRLSEALMDLYKLIWDDFCSWYLEIIKPPFGEPIDSKTYEATINFFEKLMKILHPFMPFITEEIYHNLSQSTECESIMISQVPKTKPFDKCIISNFEKAIEVVIALRNIRKQYNISFKEELNVLFKCIDKNDSKPQFDNVIKKLCNIQNLTKQSNEEGKIGLSFISNNYEFFVKMDKNIDFSSEMKKIEEEIKYLQGFYTSVNKKLSNEKFVANAKPEVVEIEKKKLSDAEIKIKTLTNQLKELTAK